MEAGKINLISVLALTLTGSQSGEVKDPHPPDTPPNVLIITADDLAFNSVGVFGCNVKNCTPNIDALAREGIRFTHAHVNTAVSQPCRQSWLTGLFPHNNGAEGFEPIDPGVATLPMLLKEAGYVSGILGKEIHHQPTEQFGWDFIPFFTETDSVWRKGNSRNPNLFQQYSLEFFQMAKERNRPFILVANSHDPHRPFIGSRIDTLTWGDHMPPVDRQYHPDEVEVFGYLPDIPGVRKEVAQYYGNVYRCDQNIGAVLRSLKESGLEANTLVIFLSDHGAAFPFSKSQCYLNSTKTPLIIRWPGKTRPGSVDSTHFVTGIDLMPTILEAAGIPVIPNLDGRSFIPLLEQKRQTNRNYAYVAFYQIFNRTRYPMRGLQNDRYGYIFNFWSDHKLVMTGDATGGITWKAMVEAAKTDAHIAERVELYRYRVPEEFYDLRRDPDALDNLADDPDYFRKLKKFRKKMLNRMKQYSDPVIEEYRNRINNLNE